MSESFDVVAELTETAVAVETEDSSDATSHVIVVNMLRIPGRRQIAQTPPCFSMRAVTSVAPMPYRLVR